MLAEGLSDAALRGLATLAARFSAATILFGAIFVPSDNRIVEEGRIPGRPDVAYRWAHDETATAVTLKVLIDGEWRTLAVGGAGPDGLVYDRDGRAVARVVSGPDRRQTLVATVDALDRAVADLRGKDGEPVAAPTTDDREPNLCPDPRKESETKQLGERRSPIRNMSPDCPTRGRSSSAAFGSTAAIRGPAAARRQGEHGLPV